MVPTSRTMSDSLPKSLLVSRSQTTREYEVLRVREWSGYARLSHCNNKRVGNLARLRSLNHKWDHTHLCAFPAMADAAEDTAKRQPDVRPALSKFDTLGSCWPSEEEEERAAEQMKTLENAFSTILTTIGEDPERQGLRKTPLRAAKALCYFTRGYEESVQCKNASHAQQPSSDMTCNCVV